MKNLLFSAVFFSSLCFANKSSTSHELIQQIATKTYDCPADEPMLKVEEMLASEDLNQVNKDRLLTHKTHWLICRGEMLQAKETLQALIKTTDKQHYSYRYALYQLGFILDVNEDKGRCKFYQQARELAESAKDDVYLSARLGLITACQQIDTGSKLGALYALLEDYAETQDKAAIAHIHNNIGLLYGSIGQNVLAAEQYEKVYELAKQVYEEKNQVSFLISAISAHSASGNFEKAAERLEQLQKANASVNTPWSNVTLHFQLARYYFRTGKLRQLKDSLKKWQVFLNQVKHAHFLEVYQWYQTYVCIAEKNTPCVQKFVDQQMEKTPAAWMLRNRDYLGLMVRVQLYLGDQQQAKKAFDAYVEHTSKAIYEQQASGKVLGVANMQAQIISLEDELATAEKSQRISYMKVIGFTALFLSLVAFLWKKRLNKLENDEITGLLTKQSIINRLENLAECDEGKANLFAIFQIDNLNDIGSKYGEGGAQHVEQQVARRLKMITRSVDLLGHINDNRFLVCLVNVNESFDSDLLSRIEQVLQSRTIQWEEGQEIAIETSRSDYISTDRVTDGAQVLQDLEDALV